MTDVSMRWVGTDATGAAAASAKKNIESVGKAASGTSGAMEKMAPAGKTATTALSSMDKAAGGVLKGLSGLGAVIGAGALVGLASQAIGAAAEMARLSEASGRLESSFNGLAGKAGQSGDAMLASLKRASGGAVSEYNLMLAANKAMMLGVASNADDMGKLMEIAATRGQAMGLSMTQAFNNLVTGLGRGSALILDNLGIMVDADATNKAYAESIGKTVDQLTEQEKKQALVNATLKEATGSTAVVASSTERLSAAWADLKVSLGDMFAPALSAGIEALAAGARGLVEVKDTVTEAFVTTTDEELSYLYEQIDAASDVVNKLYTDSQFSMRGLNDMAAQINAMIDYYQANNVNYMPAPADFGLSDEEWQLVEAQRTVMQYQGRINELVGQQVELQRAAERESWNQAGAAQQAAAQAAAAAALEKLNAANAAYNERQAASLASAREFQSAIMDVAAATSEANISQDRSVGILAQMAAQYDVLTSSSMTSTGALYTSAEAIAIVTENALGTIAGFQAMSDMAIAAGASVAGAMIAMADEVGNAFATMFAGIAAMGQDLMRIGPGSTPGVSPKNYRGQRLQGDTTPASGVSTGDQFNEFDYMQARSATKAAEALARVGGAGSSAASKLGDLAGKAGDLSGKFQGILDQIPGLTGTSDVTEEQMRLGKMGIPQNFADDYLRRLTDEVINGVDWAGVDIQDAATRAGIDPGLPSEVILELFKQSWDSSALFANAQNLDLINMDAVKAGIQQQVAAGTGKANIMALFGIGDDATVAAVAGLGLDIQSGLSGWLSENGMGDAGAKLASALGAGVSESGIPLDGGLNTWVGSDAANQAASSVGGRLSQLLSDQTVIKPTVQMPEIPSGGGTTGGGTTPNSGLPKIPTFATGTTWFGGGWARVHEGEIANLAAGPVYNARQSKKFAPAAVVVNAVINNRLDQAQFERMLRNAMRKAQVG